MEVNQELITNFFKKNCTAEEAEIVVKYLATHRDILDQYLNQSEWNSLDTKQQLSPTDTAIILAKLKQQLFAVPKTKIITLKKQYIKRCIAAAAIAFAIAGAWYYLYQQPSPTGKAFSNSIVSKNEQADTINKNNWLVKTNSGKNPVQVSLMDGSVVTLFKASSIKYQQPFAADKRELILTGEAFFNVAKNKHQPFIVYSENLSTTALGTSFKISAYPSAKQEINIKLFTGKVVIKSAGPANDWVKDIFLFPNEQLTYHRLTKETVVTSFGNNKETVINTPQTNSNNIKESKHELTFSNTPLPEVMNKLSSWYNIKINYTSSMIAQMNFTGVINRSDDIQAILKIIAQMNGLEVTQSKDGFNITKP
jgi:ferric-dicitrate binding protein FerR (iron transport regulator)